MTDKLRLRLSAQKNDNTLYTNWQITKLSNDFSEFYYKTILLNDLSQYLNQGVEGRNIIIFNSSININSQYVRYEKPILDLTKSSDIVKYYHLGSPVSLGLDQQILILHEFFEAYRRYFSIANKHKLNAGNKKENLLKLYEESKIENISEFNLVTFFEESIKNNNVANSDNTKKCIQEIQNTFKNLTHQLQKSLEEQGKHESEKFHYIFNRFERPIIGIKVADDEIKLIGSDFFVQSKFTYSNSRFLETNSIKQNSPLEMILTMSILALSSIVLILREKATLMKIQNKNGELDQEILTLKRKISDLENKAQQEGVTISQPAHVPQELINSVNRKGEYVFNEFDAEVM
ncbi:hypothetical protein GGG87_08845 [Streptococcus sp. zg-86]|uniref:Uncharacterized protein n=1 Tax=Streptococcus zhangguiae TaxID=2664091 RepID=A0A6I4RC46_9STRE|nr:MULTISPECIES: hypothetical protein [unclassified Streptococcus]MTB65102.1 hypothetical protein [Streptococcus sp. zg-86]MTB91362.1 hypothetical protein [Streptococcus sp. zg-36]MWV57089.1 hypothetical protein [Streptococcus sp. zg-70]QTH47831.1 hypothetical protein J5M87_00290 [Streptococcus sp. zg-86]